MIAWLLALVLAAHRDQRGQLGFFKDLFKGAGDALDGIRDWIVELGNKLWEVLARGFAIIRDVGDGLIDRLLLLTSGIIANARDVAGDAVNKVWEVLSRGFAFVGGKADALLDRLLLLTSGVIAAVRDVAGAAVDKLWGVLASAAAVLRDAIGVVGDKLWDVLSAGFGGVIGSVDKAASSVDDAAGALKDLPADVRDKLAPMLEQIFGLGPDMFDALLDTSEAFMRGEVSSFDGLLARLRGAKPESTWQERTLYAIVFIPGLINALMSMSQVAGEPLVQAFRADHPSALLDPDDLRDAYNRGIITPNSAIEELRRQGYSLTQADVIVQMWAELPPPSDLIRMAVREAFNEPFAAEFTTDAEFPDEFALHAESQGYTRDWARKYWRAHWELPSAQMGFDMFHRGRITGAQLDALLKALDYAPFWRKPLREIAFTVPTRVDVRRMYASGVLTLDQVHRLYLDLGYAPEFAQALTEWTRVTYGEDTAGARDLTRAAVEKAYKVGSITRDDAIGRLLELGYDEDEADFLLANVDVDIAEFQASAAARDVRELTQGTVLRAYRERILPRGEAEAFLADLNYTAEGIEIMLGVQDFEVANELTGLRAKVVETHFKAGRIAGGEARAQLAGAGMNADRADLTVQRWEAQVSEKSRELTQSQLERAMEKGLIDEVTYVDRLGALGYDDEDAAILLGLADRLSIEGVRQLSASTIVSVYRRGVLSRETTKERLILAGFSPDDAELQLRAVDADLARADEQRRQREAAAAAAAIRELSQGAIGNAYKRGIITRADATARLVALGFAAEDADIILRTIDAAAATSAATP